MIAVKCDRCKTPLNKLGALIFSPPIDGSTVIKFHICIEVWIKHLNYKNGPIGWVVLTFEY